MAPSNQSERLKKAPPAAATTAQVKHAKQGMKTRAQGEKESDVKEKERAKNREKYEKSKNRKKESGEFARALTQQMIINDESKPARLYEEFLKGLRTKTWKQKAMWIKKYIKVVEVFVSKSCDQVDFAYLAGKMKKGKDGVSSCADDGML